MRTRTPSTVLQKGDPYRLRRLLIRLLERVEHLPHPAPDCRAPAERRRSLYHRPQRRVLFLDELPAQSGLGGILSPLDDALGARTAAPAKVCLHNLVGKPWSNERDVDHSDLIPGLDRLARVNGDKAVRNLQQAVRDTRMVEGGSAQEEASAERLAVQ